MTEIDPVVKATGKKRATARDVGTATTTATGKTFKVEVREILTRAAKSARAEVMLPGMVQDAARVIVTFSDADWTRLAALAKIG